MDEDADGISSKLNRHQNHIVNEINVFLSVSPDLAGGVDYILSAPRREIPTTKLIEIINLLKKNEMLDDFISAADGKPELIKFGIERLIMLSHHIKGRIAEDEFNDIFEGEFSPLQWKKAFEHIYSNLYDAQKPIESGKLSVLAAKNIKKGFAGYFYNLAMEYVTDASGDDPSRVFLNVVTPSVIEEVTHLQRQRSINPQDKHKLLESLVDGAMHRLQGVVEQKLPRELQECFSEGSSAAGSCAVNYQGLFVAAHARLKHHEDAFNRVIKKGEGGVKAVQDRDAYVAGMMRDSSGDKLLKISGLFTSVIKGTNEGKSPL